MCPGCESFCKRLTFEDPNDYVAFIRLLVEEVKQARFTVTYTNCPLEDLVSAPPWPTADVITHDLQCAACRQPFHLYANVWNGRNWWEPQFAGKRTGLQPVSQER